MNTPEAAVKKILATLEPYTESCFSCTNEKCTAHKYVAKDRLDAILHAMSEAIRAAAWEETKFPKLEGDLFDKGYEVHRVRMLEYADAISNKIQKV